MKVYQMTGVDNSGDYVIVITWLCDYCYRHGQDSKADARNSHEMTMKSATKEGVLIFKDRDLMPFSWMLIHHNSVSLHLCSSKCVDSMVADCLGGHELGAD